MGNKNSGRKTKKEEKEAAIEEITAAALTKLARSKVHKQLNTNLDFDQTKEMALPIVLKDITTKTDLNLNGQIVFMPAEIAIKNGLPLSQEPKPDSQ